MTDIYHAMIVGGGHNGLAVATYLAKAGKRVLVLEARDTLGGAAGTREFYPGFSVSECAHLLYGLHPRVVNELKLHIPLAAKRLSTISLGREADHVKIDDGYVSNVSSEDAGRYGEFHGKMMRYAKLLADTLTERPPKLAENDFSDKVMLAKLALKVRLLGKQDMRELLRVGAINIYDVLEEELENPLLKGALSLDAVLGGFAGPRSPNTVLSFLYRHAGSAIGCAGPGIPKGGMGAVSQALAKVAAENGVEVRTNAKVSRIDVIKGKVTGLQLEDGENVSCGCVVSNADLRTTFRDLVGYSKLETEFARRVHNHRAKGAAAKLHLALDGLPEVHGLSKADLGQRLLIAPSPSYVEQAFDHVKYREVSAKPVLEITIPTLHDSSLAPSGQHVLSAIVQYAPGEAADSNAANQFEANIMAALEERLPGIGQHVIASELLMPADLEATYGMTGGHWHHGEYALDQFLMLRPVPGAAQYATPISGLYLCGAGCHPGGNVMGVAGRNCAKAVLKGALS